MIIGFVGAAATGKSWAAAKVAALLSCHYQGSRAAEIAADTEFDVNAPHTFEERLGYQREILSWMESDLLDNPNAVFDRTPIDLMAFSILSHNDESGDCGLKHYLNDCIEVCDYFDMIVLVSPPADELAGAGEYKPGRLSAEVHGYNFRVLFDQVVKNLLMHPRLRDKVVVIPEDCHYEDRITFVMEKIRERQEQSASSRD